MVATTVAVMGSTGSIGTQTLEIIQDHPDEFEVVVLGAAPHNSLATVRVLRKDGSPLPVWGLQFHPEAARKRIERSVKLGHISAEEAMAFERDHDGAQVLANFAQEAVKNRYSQ